MFLGISAALAFQRQFEDWTCGPRVLSDALFKMFGLHVSEQELALMMETDMVHGTEQHMFGAVVDKLNKLNVKRNLKLEWEARAGRTIDDLRRLMRKRAVVIVNFLDPSLQEGHYAMVQAVEKERIILCDPWHGPGYALPLRDFERDWHPEISGEVRWAFAMGEGI